MAPRKRFAEAHADEETLLGAAGGAGCDLRVLKAVPCSGCNDCGGAGGVKACGQGCGGDFLTPQDVDVLLRDFECSLFPDEEDVLGVPLQDVVEAAADEFGDDDVEADEEDGDEHEPVASPAPRAVGSSNQLRCIDWTHPLSCERRVGLQRTPNCNMFLRACAQFMLARVSAYSPAWSAVWN